MATKYFTERASSQRPLAIWVDDSFDVEMRDRWFRISDPEFDVVNFADTDSAVECAVKNAGRIFAFVQDANRSGGVIIPQWKTLARARAIPMHALSAADFHTFVVDAFAPTAGSIFFAGYLSPEDDLLLDAWSEADPRIIKVYKPLLLPDMSAALANQLLRWRGLTSQNGVISSDAIAVLQAGDELAVLCAGRAEFLDKLSPRQFEELIASIFRNHGFDVELTARTRDGGYDIIALSSGRLERETVLIEVKHFAPNRPVGVGIVRTLYGVKHLTHASRIVLATSSYVSVDAKREFARVIPWELELVERNEVLGWCASYARDVIISKVST